MKPLYYLMFLFLYTHTLSAQTANNVNSKFDENQSVLKLIEGDFKIDSDHTRVSFTIPHLVISEVEGRFDIVEGSFKIDKSFLNSKFKATVPVASISTGVKQRDDHLRSEDFFDVKKFPNMKFESKSITGTYDNFKMVASLTIKGVTKDVLFSGSYSGHVVEKNGKERVGLKATAKISRKDFNITYNPIVDVGPLVGDLVDIKIIAEGIRQ